MKIKAIEFPEELIDAQRRGTLVAFAGAGVSIGTPSDLPTFEALVELISGGTLERISIEPIDQFLGKLDKRGIDVHCRTCDIIGNPSSKPTLLHRALLSLFPSANKVRLVTTNFDRHFTSVARELFSDPVDVFYAPALPLGHKFNGIVYLHGCIDRPSKDLVLTDGDFGRAYLTEGWAARFLQAMFASFTVLFVGYSHDDMAMNYLSRALPHGSGQRYALTVSGQDERWSFLGITPLSYSKAKGRYPHVPLRRSIEAWYKLSKMGALDHERKIRELVSLSPPVDLEEQDYLRNVLRDMENIQFFVRYAKTPDWLRWAENNLPIFGDLFQLAPQANQASQELATWFAHNFICEYPEEALAVVQRQGNVIGPILWHGIALRLHRDPHPDPVIFGKWVSILLNANYPHLQTDVLGWLLASCCYPGDKETAVLLFEHMTKPQLNFRPHFKFSDKDPALVDIEVSLQKESYWLNDSWDKYFKPNLSVFAESLAPIVESHLRKAHMLLRSVGKATDRWDQISLLRSAIEPHEQDEHHAHDFILIDAARDILEFLLMRKPVQADYLIECWGDSTIPLLERLAIHGMSENTACSPDDKVAWLLRKGWLYKGGIKHEVFRLLKLAYPKTSNKTRLQLLKETELGPQGQYAEGYDEDGKKYAVYNLLVWLRQTDPNCTLVRERLEVIQSASPNFQPHEYPDFDFWMMTGFGGLTSPVTADELLASEPSDTIDFLLCYQEEKFIGPSREGLLNALAEVVARSFDWSWKLVTALQITNESDIDLDLWECLLHGWEHAQLTEKQWDLVLNVLNTHPRLKKLAPAAVDLLKEALTEQAKLPLSCLPLLEGISDKLWEEYVAKSSEQVELMNDDWLGTAINRLSGKVTEVWLHALSRRRAEAADTWNGIPVEYKERFERVVLPAGPPAVQFGRVVLASQIHFLFALDADWTENLLFPLLDWSIDATRAEQSWHGYLVWGLWNHTMLPKLLPLYKQTFSYLTSKLPKEMRERFCRHLASIAIFSTINPLQDGWLWDFLNQVDADDRKAWASAVRLELDSLKEDAASDLWDRWMSKYWSERITGVPTTLTPGELEEMIHWAIELEPVFPLIVDKICASDAPRLENTDLYRLLNERQFASKHPAALTKLLLHLLPNAAQPFWQCNDAENLVRSLLETSVSRTDLREVCNQLARLGCSSASELGRVCNET